MAYHLVRLTCGPAWDHTRPRRDQRGWDAHAAYLDTLAEHGVVLLGGPVGGDDGPDAVLVIDAYDEAAVLALIAADPWAYSVLTVVSVEPWSIWLRAPEPALG
jgi:uncharacterized protein YciI